MSCDPYRCTDGVGCPATCSVDADCISSAYCDDLTKQCLPRRAGGAACASAHECSIEFANCVDGVCCNQPCDKQCEHCTDKGACVPTVGEPVGMRTKCTAAPSGQPCKSAACDGIERGSCLGFATSKVVCQAASCTGGTQTIEARCDGKGNCGSVAPKPCAPYACGTTNECLTTCSSDADCQAPATCESSSKTCVNAGKCTDDVTLVSADGKKTTDCRPYRCDASGKCNNNCTTSDQCAPGNVCDTATSTCAAEPAGSSEDSGGCSTGRSSSSGGVHGLRARHRRARTRTTPAEGSLHGQIDGEQEVSSQGADRERVARSRRRCRRYVRGMRHLLLASVLLLVGCGDSASEAPSTASADSAASEDSVTVDSIAPDSAATDTAPEDTGVTSDHLYILHGGTTAPATIDLCMKASSASAYTDPPVLKAQGLAAVPFKGMSHVFDAPAVAKTGAVSLRIIDGAKGDCTVATSLGELPSESFFVNRLLVVGAKSMRTTAPGYGDTMLDTLTYEQVVDGIDLSFVPSSGTTTPLNASPVTLMAGTTGKLVSTKGERAFKAADGGRVFALAFDDGITLCDIARPAVGGLTDCSADLRKP